MKDGGVQVDHLGGHVRTASAGQATERLVPAWTLVAVPLGYGIVRTVVTAARLAT